MRVLLAPGPLWPEPGGTPLVGAVPGLEAPAVAQALAVGWHEARPADELTLLPLGDGGPGSAATLPAHLVEDRLRLRAADPLGRAQEVSLLRLRAPGPAGAGLPVGPGLPVHRYGGAQAPVWFLDAASLMALPADRSLAGRHARQGSSRGLGELLLQALEQAGSGATLVVGLTRTALHDGGAGLLESLGGLPQAREHLRRCHVVLALGDELPLGGLSGAGASLPQVTDLDQAQAQELDRRCGALARALCRQQDQQDQQPGRLLPMAGQRPQPLSATSWGTGAAGGAALALRLAGASAAPGAQVLGRLCGLGAAVENQDLCLSATGSLYTLGSSPTTVLLGQLAQQQALPLVLVAGRCRVPRTELAEGGVVSVYELESLPGLQPPVPWERLGTGVLEQRLQQLGGRLARSWSR